MQLSSFSWNTYVQTIYSQHFKYYNLNHYTNSFFSFSKGRQAKVCWTRGCMSKQFLWKNTCWNLNFTHIWSCDWSKWKIMKISLNCVHVDDSISNFCRMVSAVFDLCNVFIWYEDMFSIGTRFHDIIQDEVIIMWCKRWEVSDVAMCSTHWPDCMFEMFAQII